MSNHENMNHEAPRSGGSYVAPKVGGTPVKVAGTISENAARKLAAEKKPAAAVDGDSKTPSKKS